MIENLRFGIILFASLLIPDTHIIVHANFFSIIVTDSQRELEEKIRADTKQIVYLLTLLYPLVFKLTMISHTVGKREGKPFDSSC